MAAVKAGKQLRTESFAQAAPKYNAKLISFCDWVDLLEQKHSEALNLQAGSSLRCLPVFSKPRFHI